MLHGSQLAQANTALLLRYCGDVSRKLGDLERAGRLKRVSTRHCRGEHRLGDPVLQAHHPLLGRLIAQRLIQRGAAGDVGKQNRALLH